MKSGHRLFLFLILSGIPVPMSGQALSPATPSGPARLDLNGDGIVNGLDILLFIEGWEERGILSPTPTPVSRSINGFVTSSETGSGLSGARVIAGTANAFSEADGFYELNGVRTDIDAIRAVLAGFAESVVPIDDPSIFLSIDIMLAPILANTPTPTVTITSTPTPTPTETTTITSTPSQTETPTIPDIVTVELPAPRPLRLVRIPAGAFMMGSPDTERGRDTDEGPVHEVTIGADFYLGETEVTQAQWEAVMGSIPAADNGVGGNYPVYAVSWDDCQEFIASLNGLGQGTFRLPSEAEWEYACRAGSTTRFFYGDSLDCGDACENCAAGNADLPVRARSDFMWYCGSSGGSSQPVGQLLPNSFGLYDMAGNVLEWCQDFYHEDYTGAPTDGSVWDFGGGDGNRVIRDGDWFNSAVKCRSANRGFGVPSFRYDLVGLRVAWTP